MGRVFANGPGDWGQIPGQVISKTQKMVHDISSFKTQHYKYGDFYKPQKARFIPTFCKRINRTSTAVGIWVDSF